MIPGTALAAFFAFIFTLLMGLLDGWPNNVEFIDDFLECFYVCFSVLGILTLIIIILVISFHWFREFCVFICNINNDTKEESSDSTDYSSVPSDTTDYSSLSSDSTNSSSISSDSNTLESITQDILSEKNSQTNNVVPIALRCLICLINQRSIIFYPCNHACCCSECAQKDIIKCPICRENIKKIGKIYL